MSLVIIIVAVINKVFAKNKAQSPVNGRPSSFNSVSTSPPPRPLWLEVLALLRNKLINVFHTRHLGKVLDAPSVEDHANIYRNG